MTFYLMLDGEACRVEIRTTAGGGAAEYFFARGDGALEHISAEAVMLGPGVLSMLAEGASYEARLDVAPTGSAVVLHGRRYAFSSYDPRSLQARRGAAGYDDGPRTLHSPMPGRVLRILLAAGSAVEAQQGILVVEAMKMQNELKSPKSGTMARILVAEGETVTAGQALATIT